MSQELGFENLKTGASVHCPCFLIKDQGVNSQLAIPATMSDASARPPWTLPLWSQKPNKSFIPEVMVKVLYDSNRKVT